MSLQTIEQSLAAAAAAEWAKLKAAGTVVVQVIEADTVTVFEQLTKQFAPLLMSTVSSLAVGELAALSGGEKTNLAVTTVVDQAAQQGVTILATDATAMVKNAFEAFKAAAPTVVPAAVGDAVQGALDAGEDAVEGAVESGAAAVEGAMDGEANKAS